MAATDSTEESNQNGNDNNKESFKQMTDDENKSELKLTSDTQDTGSGVQIEPNIDEQTKPNTNNNNHRAVSRNKNTSNKIEKETLYQCQFENCGKAFRQKYSLTRHSEMHTNSKSVVCDVCYIEIPTGETLDGHTDIHRDGSPLVCICDKRLIFKNLQSLRKHKVTCNKHHAAMKIRKSYVCNQCGSKFTRKDSLGIHLLSLHKHVTVENQQPEQKSKVSETRGKPEFTQRRSNRTKTRQNTERLQEKMKNKTNKQLRTAKEKEGEEASVSSCNTNLKISNLKLDQVDNTKGRKNKTAKMNVPVKISNKIQSGKSLRKLKSGVSEMSCTDSSDKSRSERSPEIELSREHVTKQEVDSDQFLGFRGKLENMENIDISAINAEEVDILDDLKNAIGKLSTCGKDVLVISVEQTRCHWFGSPVATNFVDENHHLIFSFYKYCHDMKMKDFIMDVAETPDNTTEVMVKVEVNRDDFQSTGNATAATTAAATAADNVDMPLDDNIAGDVEMFEEDYELYDSDDIEMDIDGLIDDIENKPIDNPAQTVRFNLKMKYEERSDGTPVIDFEEENAEKKKKETGHWSIVMKEAKLDNYTCTKCGNRFIHEQHFKTHQRRRPNCDNSAFVRNVSNKDILAESITYKDPQSGQEIMSTIEEMIKTQEEYPYTCLLCESSFNSEGRLQRHAITHVKRNIFECYICGQRYKLLDCLRSHLQKTHFKKPYECETCSKCFRTQREMLVHSESTCQRLARAHLVEDINEEQKLLDLTCDVCGYKAGNRSLLLAHHSSHGDVKQYICTMCTKVFSSMSGLERHLVCAHHDKKPFKCSICNKQFKEMCSFRRHKKLHGEKLYSCEVCGRKFGEKGYLKSHMLVHTKEKPYVCDFCGEKYKKKNFFDNHRRLHTGERPYKCDFEDCDKSFRSPQSLKQHKRTHCKVGSYICDICGRRFKQPGQLNHHRKNHTVEWRWPCAYCPEKFKSCWRYKNHLAKCHPEMKTEIEKTTNIRLHECEQCKKVYHDPEDLRRHVNNHLGIKPFNCPTCNKSFSDKSNLGTHMHIHAGTKKVKCTICYKGFIHEKNLLAHVEKVHPGKSLENETVPVQKKEIRTQNQGAQLPANEVVPMQRKEIRKQNQCIQLTANKAGSMQRKEIRTQNQDAHLLANETVPMQSKVIRTQNQGARPIANKAGPMYRKEICTHNQGTQLPANDAELMQRKEICAQNQCTQLPANEAGPMQRKEIRTQNQDAHLLANETVPMRRKEICTQNQDSHLLANEDVPMQRKEICTQNQGAQLTANNSGSMQRKEFRTHNQGTQLPANDAELMQRKESCEQNQGTALPVIPVDTLLKIEADDQNSLLGNWN